MADGRPVTESIGQRIARLRRERSLSQRELATTGVSFTYVSRIEAGQRQPSVKAIRALAVKLGVSPEYLETGRDLAPTGDRELRVTDAELQVRLDGSSDAEGELRAVLAEAHAAGDLPIARRARIALALSLAREGCHEEVIEMLEEHLERDRPAVAERPDLYALLGRAYAAAGENPRSIALFSRCLEEIRGSKDADPILFVRFASYLSYALVDAGDGAAAQRVLADALERADGVSDRYTLIRLYWSLGRFYAVEGPPGRALDYVRRAIALLEATEDTFHLARAHQLCAVILLDQESGQMARKHLERAEELLVEEASPGELGALTTERARLELQLDQPDTAREYALEALSLLEGGAAVDVGHAWRTLAEVFERLGDTDLAERSYRTAVEVLTEQGASRQLAETYRAWGKFLRAQGREDEALDVFERAADLAVFTVAPHGVDVGDRQHR